MGSTLVEPASLVNALAGGQAVQMERTERTMGWEALLDLAWRRVGLVPEVFISPGVPSGKEAAVRDLHEIPGDEPVLVVLDDTAFGGAKDGAVLTPERLCWRDMMAKAHQRLWTELTPDAVEEADGGEVKVVGEPISMDLIPHEQRPRIAAFLREVIAGEAPAPQHPFRAGRLELGYRDGPVEARAVLEKQILELTQASLGDDECTHLHPEIPERKLRRAREAHAQVLRQEERLLVVHDATVFGSAEEGFALTGRRLCWKNLGEQARQIPWEYLPAEAIVRRGSSTILLGGCRMDLLVDEKETAAVRELLANIRELFR